MRFFLVGAGTVFNDNIDANGFAAAATGAVAVTWTEVTFLLNHWPSFYSIGMGKSLILIERVLLTFDSLLSLAACISAFA